MHYTDKRALVCLPITPHRDTEFRFLVFLFQCDEIVLNILPHSCTKTPKNQEPFVLHHCQQSKNKHKFGEQLGLKLKYSATPVQKPFYFLTKLKTHQSICQHLSDNLQYIYYLKAVQRSLVII